MPGKVSGKVQPRQAFLMPIVGKGPSLKRPAVVASNAVASDTVVVRVSVDAKYLQQSEWQSIQSKPRAAVQNWLSKTMPATLANAVFDMWGFQEEATKGGGRPIITGLLRIEKSSSKAFIGNSGKTDGSSDDCGGMSQSLRLVMWSGSKSSSTRMVQPT